MLKKDDLGRVVKTEMKQSNSLGDFKYPTATKTATTFYYTYDGNGNMIIDQNKKVTGMSYNIINLPSVITVAGKGPLNITMMHPATSCRNAP